jgi:hypothetical protein
MMLVFDKDKYYLFVLGTSFAYSRLYLLLDTDAELLDVTSSNVLGFGHCDYGGDDMGIRIVMGYGAC